MISETSPFGPRLSASPPDSLKGDGSWSNTLATIKESPQYALRSVSMKLKVVMSDFLDLLFSSNSFKVVQ